MCLAIIGGVIGAVGALASASAQSASYKAQAKYAERQAVMEQQRGAYEAGRLNDQTTRRIADMRGQFLSSGVALSGSADDVIGDSATEASLDEQAVKYGARVRSDNYRFEASLARMNARSAQTAGVIGALGSVVNGMVQQTGQAAQSSMIKNPYLAFGGG